MNKSLKKILYYYGNSIQPENLSPFLNTQNIQVLDLKFFSPQEDALILFLLEDSFFEDNTNSDFIKNYIEKNSVLLLKQNEDNFIYDDLILFYMDHPSANNSKLQQNILKAFKQKENQTQFKTSKVELNLAQDKIHELQNIAMALSAEKDIKKLLEVILRLCTDMTAADAGSLYLVQKNADKESESLRFVLNRNHTLKIDSVPFNIPLNKKSISGFVALTKKPLNIKDSYKIETNLEYSHSKVFDTQYNYVTKSMLTLPMIDHKDEVIGVIQLINKKSNLKHKLNNLQDFEDYVEEFSQIDENFAYALASQAAVALENAFLYEEIQNLFEGFVFASIKAIESRDPVTSGHSERVASYSLKLAKAVNECKEGLYKNIYFNEEQLKELRYACLLHDFGKVGVKEAVLTKEKKLGFYQTQNILSKIELAILAEQNKLLKKEITNENTDQELKNLKKLKTFSDKIIQCNNPGYLTDDAVVSLKTIYKYRYSDLEGNKKQILSDDEYKKLSLRKGNLTLSERKEIESHVTHSYRFLQEIPWTKELKNIPKISYAHHEKLDGSGYPLGLKEEQIPLQSKIIAIADIFDALIAEDRPYKKALSIEKSLQILKEEASFNHLDPELLNIFINQKVYIKNSL